MLVVIAFHSGDKDQAIRLAQWIALLGNVSDHRCLIVTDNSTDATGVFDPLDAVFKYVEEIKHPFAPKGWPQGPNAMFDYTCRYVQEFIKEPFLWLEPDAIPLCTNWLKIINFAYQESGKPFMGAYVDIKSTYPDGINHMSGVAVYPQDIARLAPDVFNNVTVAWDIVGAKQILPQMHETHLIHHSWKAENFPDAVSLERLNIEAVIYHQNKDGSLIQRLMERDYKIPPIEGQEEITYACDTSNLKQTIFPIGGLKEAIPAISNVVTTFYDPLDNLRDDRLLELFKANWEYYGWIVKVVNLQSAKEADPLRYKRYEKSKTLYKGHCSRDYLFRCYARWLCMLKGGFMVDFDVFNYGFTPKMFADIVKLCPIDKVIHFSGDSTPCAGYGSPKAYEQFVTVFDDFNKNPIESTDRLKENIHDLNIIETRPDTWFGVKLCGLYKGEEDGLKYPLTHFTHGFVQYPRSERIAKIRDFETVPE